MNQIELSHHAPLSKKSCKPFLSTKWLHCQARIWYMYWDTEKATKWHGNLASTGAIWSVFSVNMQHIWVLRYSLRVQQELIRLYRCRGWSESLLATYPFVGFIVPNSYLKDVSHFFFKGVAPLCLGCPATLKPLSFILFEWWWNTMK